MYFDGAGRAELARLALNAGGLSFTDKRVAFAEWPAIKADPESLPSQFFGSMPLLTVNGESVAQSTAIAMLAADLSLHKSLTPMQRAKCVMFQGVHADLQSAMYKCLFGSDESKKAGADALPGSAANLLKGVENQLPASGFVNGGDAPTLADLALFDVVSSPFPGLKALKVDLSPYPKLNALTTAVAEFGPLKPYLEKRGF
jgi:glutathione S-transferase